MPPFGGRYASIPATGNPVRRFRRGARRRKGEAWIGLERAPFHVEVSPCVAYRVRVRRMITELGHMALILALCVALIQSSIPLLGAARGNSGWMAVGRNTALVQFGLVAVAMAALMHAYV